MEVGVWYCWPFIIGLGCNDSTEGQAVMCNVAIYASTAVGYLFIACCLLWLIGSCAVTQHPAVTWSASARWNAGSELCRVWRPAVGREAARRSWPCLSATSNILQRSSKSRSLAPRQLFTVTQLRWPITMEIRCRHSPTQLLTVDEPIRTIVRENVRNTAKKRKKSRLFGLDFEKKHKKT